MFSGHFELPVGFGGKAEKREGETEKPVDAGPMQQLTQMSKRCLHVLLSERALWSTLSVLTTLAAGTVAFSGIVNAVSCMLSRRLCVVGPKMC
ncbi:hypothetical protein KOW79_018083 [Hemibagrus wyckioides]|uniref:Uncharacterized protein n=1 Tax=Hemibagrus wyckioides TaxID=337641 RepID=A0A9D3NBM5_9TELE|nr:hypothetical protein KOW79_018083 [Hemibagrus wyckioides]